MNGLKKLLSFMKKKRLVGESRLYKFHTGPSFYGKEEFRYNAVKNIEGQLHKGEILYFELVGYTETGQPLMSDQDASKLKDKEITKRYGKKMHYSYGCVPGNCELYVYRITRTNEDGDSIELSWPQVKARCNELGIKFVPELTKTPIVYGVDWGGPTVLAEFVELFTDGSSTLDDSHIREGVVVRVEQPDGNTDWYKNKSFTFGVLEGFWKESDDAVDLEEIS